MPIPLCRHFALSSVPEQILVCNVLRFAAARCVVLNAIHQMRPRCYLLSRPFPYRIHRRRRTNLFVVSPATYNSHIPPYSTHTHTHTNTSNTCSSCRRIFQQQSQPSPTLQISASSQAPYSHSTTHREWSQVSETRSIWFGRAHSFFAFFAIAQRIVLCEFFVCVCVRFTL